MSKGIHEALRVPYETLSNLFAEHLEAAQELQRTLVLEILPGLVDECQLDESSQEFCLEWLEDIASIFRTLRRHKFISSFALEALRDTLSWRLKILRPLRDEPPSPFLRCLPTSVRDPFGRPILILKLAPLSDSTANLKNAVIHHMELMRLHLVHVNGPLHMVARPVLQYVALLDISGATFNNVQQNIELFNWFVRELLPRFPGMLGAVFVLNYSWTHAGLWNLAKRLLPVTTLERVFFPSEAELHAYFSRQALPKDVGGDLPPLSTVQNPLHRYTVPPSPPELQMKSVTSIPNHDDTPVAPTPTRRGAGPSDTSLLNPFYGYPVVYDSSSVPALRYGRRRKRDLARTLLRLWWSRWRHHVRAIAFVLAILLAFLFYRRRVWWQRRWRFVAPILELLATVPVPFG